ncbi:MAG: hypothetical protein JXN62_08800 [Bacteroidales bacterium]|nr:hypothetical protein [Bacteroidales bacterium]
MKKLILTLLFLAGFFTLPAFSQNDTVDVVYDIADTINKDIRLFERDDLLELSLRFDITTYRRKRSSEEYLPAVLTYHISEADSINKDIKLRARGIMRLGYCDYPPIRLNFKKTKSPDDEFSNIDKLKLVTHCKLGNENYLLTEFLIYKLYNILTENSFRVRLVRMNYINTHKESKPVRQFGFVIEPIEALCTRTNSHEISSKGVDQPNIKADMMDRMAIFNYMIGNTDWYVSNHHNVVILVQPHSERPDLGAIIPYDFDYAGLVNADYAVPHEAVPIKTVRERYYCGICRTEEEFTEALKEFSDKKEEFYNIIRDFPYMNDKQKKGLFTYLDEFYKDFDKRNSIVYKLLSECKKY